jgi:hypothetical protein
MSVNFDLQDQALRFSAEIAADREARLRYEAAVIARAQADIDAGLGLEWEDVEDWLIELERNPNATFPQPRAPVLDR